MGDIQEDLGVSGRHLGESGSIWEASGRIWDYLGGTWEDLCENWYLGIWEHPRRLGTGGLETARSPEAI